MEQNSIIDIKFKALADQTRRKILQYLMDESKTAGEIAKQFPISAPSVSYHLSILEKSKLISSKKNKGFIYYGIELTEIEDVITWLKKL